MSARWSLTQDALGQLLERLGTDAETAAREYQALRERLVDYFVWRGVRHPDVAADETLDRAARRLEEGEAVQQIGPYVHAIARYVLLEHQRLDLRERRALAGAARELAAPADTSEPRSACLVRCLRQLPEEGRALIVAYYTGEGRSHLESRRALATRLGISYDSLKARAHRLRIRLGTCLRDCVKAGGPCD